MPSRSIPDEILAHLAKFAGARAATAVHEPVEPVTNNGWSLPDGDALVRLDLMAAEADVSAGLRTTLSDVFVRTRTVSVGDDIVVTAALTSDKAYVSVVDGELQITPELASAAITGPDGEELPAEQRCELATRYAVVAAAQRPIFDQLVAMQVI